MLRSRWLFVVLYTLSGAAALVYEVTWTRLLTLQMGHTVSAVSTVLAAFMGGLAVGAWIAGRLRLSGPRRLRAYAALEILVAAIAIALPLLLRAAYPALAWAYADGDSMLRFAFARAVLSAFLLALPAAAMGATFPIAASWFAERTARLAPNAAARSFADAGVLYAANTAGAAAGAIAAGFWLIPSLGLRGATGVGVALNIGAALGALSLSRHDTSLAGTPTSAPVRADATSAIRKDKQHRRQQPRHERVAPAAAPQPALAWTAAAVSGFAALVFEVAFTRLLALVIGPTTYAFATMAASFITGLALGSAAGARLSRTVSRPAYWLAGTLAITAIGASMASSYAASRLPLVVAAEVASGSVTFTSVVVRQAVEVTLLLLPLTFALGAAFPLALATASAGTGSIDADAARVYVANTLGAISGSIAAGFLLVPRFGLQITFRGTSCAAIAAAVAIAGWAALSGRERRTTRRVVVLGALAAAGLLGAILIDVPPWDRELLASGAYKYAPYIHAGDAGDFAASLRAGRLEYYKEGAAGTVSVRRLTGRLALAIDGKVDASNAGDMLTQRLLGVLPVLVHGHPDQLCVIGLGSGVTVASAMATGLVHHADVVEISPEVVAASALFAHENANVLASPHVRLIVGDAPYAEQYITDLKARARGDKRIIFTGFVFGQDYRALQQNAYCYVHATEVGGTHPALLEAMGYGNCVLTLATPENLEVVGDAGVTYSDEMDLTEKLQRVLRDGSLVQAYRNRAQLRIRSHYDWDRVVDQYEELFNRMRGNHGPVEAAAKTSEQVRVLEAVTKD